MMQPWLVERMAREHRRDLTALARPIVPAVTSVTDVTLAHGPARPVTAAALPVGRSWRRPLGHQVGALLIRAGTRLGGATMTPS
jgi:hypothetical protein